MLPGPTSVAIHSVSASFQSTSCLASGETKPSLTKALATRSNSRTTTASAPPRDSDSRQCR
jgi:hypothetical protein